MKPPRLTTLALLLALASPWSGQAQIKNGDFDTWTTGESIQNWAEGWTADAPQVRAPSLTGDSGHSAIISNSHFISQKLSPKNPRDFQLSLVVAVLESDVKGYEQPFVLSLDSKTPDGKTFVWMHLRLDRLMLTDPLRLRARGSVDWSEPIGGAAAITGVSYDETTNTFLRPKAYQLTLTYSGTTDTYSVAIGPVGRPLTPATGLKFYRAPSSPAGLTGIMLWAYNRGFAVDRVTLTSPAPKTP